MLRGGTNVEGYRWMSSKDVEGIMIGSNKGIEDSKGGWGCCQGRYQYGGSSFAAHEGTYCGLLSTSAIFEKQMLVDVCHH